MAQHVVVQAHCTDNHDSWFQEEFAKPVVVCCCASILPDKTALEFCNVSDMPFHPSNTMKFINMPIRVLNSPVFLALLKCLGQWCLADLLVFYHQQ